MLKAHTFNYGRPVGLPAPCLHLRFSLSTTNFYKGTQVQWFSKSATDSPDWFMYELSLLFALFTGLPTYVNPRITVSPPGKIGLRSV